MRGFAEFGSVRFDSAMIRETSLRFLVALSVGATAISCSHPNYQTRVTNVGEGGNGYVLTRVPIDRPPTPPMTPLPPGNASTHETGVRKAESDWMTALKEHSPFALADLMEDRFVLVSPDGSTLGKEEFVALVRDGRLVVQSETLDEAVINEYGNAAFMTGVLKVQGTRDGDDISGNYRFADTWIWKSGKWRKAAGVFLGLKE
jgi:ketosteroid isomerase-like protein